MPPGAVRAPRLPLPVAGRSLTHKDHMILTYALLPTPK
jgi:hypothetical protein